MTPTIFTERPGHFRRTWIWAVPVMVFVLFIIGQILVLVPAKFLGLISR